MKTAILGYGTIGSGVAEVLCMNKEKIEKNAGKPVELKYILDLREFPGDPNEDKVVHDIQIILDDPEVEVVVETMGGLEPAHTFVKKALEAGKSVATSNKELVAKYGCELIKVAKSKDVNFFFEASVGGGIPIIRPLLDCVTADKVLGIDGILNGTTNYMLTKMAKEGAAYDDVLKEAQALGYAELHQEADVEGYDPCRKIAILTALVIGKQVDFEDIYTEGITKLAAEDFMYAKALGGGIKLIGTSVINERGVFAKVSPAMVSEDDPLRNVNDVFNGITIQGNALGDIMFYGKGAGKLATASAVISDVIVAAKAKGHQPIIWEADKQEIQPIEAFESRFFVRMKGCPKCHGEKLSDVFGQIQIVKVPALEGEFGFLTEKMTVGEFEAGRAQFEDIISRLFVHF